MILYKNADSFATKTELEAFVRTALMSYSEDPHYIEPWDLPFRFFITLLKRHPDFATKTKKGVAGFRVRKNFIGQGKAIDLKDCDGDWINFSWRVCVSGRPKKASIFAAMRTSVIPQINNFRGEAHKLECLSCGSTEKVQVDHIRSFDSIAKEFLALHMDFPTVFDEDARNLPCFRPEDKIYEAKWKAFHAIRSRFQLLCVSCNLKKGNL